LRVAERGALTLFSPRAITLSAEVSKPPRKMSTYKAIRKIGPGFWNIRAQFKVAIGLLDIGTHMSLIQLNSGKFLVIDAVTLTDQMKAEFDELTEKGTKIEAVLHTHPFHTLSIPAFYKAYPIPPHYGCPRHLKNLTDIKWAGNLNDCKIQSTWSPEVELSVPVGAEFVAPQPEKSNHFSCVFVYHKGSGTLHVDDTIMYSENPGFLLKLGGYKQGSLSWHPTIKGPGLLPNPEAPRQFKEWLENLIRDWNFDNICTAHFGVKIGGVKLQLLEVIKQSEPLFDSLVQKRKDSGYKPEDTPSTNVNGCECG